MARIKLTLVCLLLFSIPAAAQKLTGKEKTVFDQIAYKRMQQGNYEVINKWVVPIRYKIYGDAPEYLVKEIDSTFSQLRGLTQLDIQKTTENDDANFLIAVGSKEIGNLAPNMAKYANSAGGNYYKTNRNSEITRAECLIMPEKYSDKAGVRHVIKKNIVKCIGFFNPTPLAPSSLFYNASNGKLKIDEFDSNIIRVMYLPIIKPGMDKDQVDAILK